MAAPGTGSPRKALRSLFVALLGGAAAFLSPPAHAQPPARVPASAPPPSPPPPAPDSSAPTPGSDPTAAAQALFQQASEKLDQRDFAAACPMLEEVLRLEPGAHGARLALAECYEGSGRLASAHNLYSLVAEAAARLGQTERQTRAEARAIALRPRLGAVIAQVAPEVRALPGLAISVCGELLPTGAHGRPRPADRGACTILAVAPGKVPWERTLQVTDGVTTSVTVERLDDLPGPADARPPAAPAEAPTPVVAPNSPLSPPAPPPDRSHRGQIGALVRVDIDVLNGGAVTALGASYAPSDHIEVGLSGLLGKRGGFEPAVTGYLLTGALKPYINVGVPVLFEGGPYAGIRGSVGVEWDPHRNIGVFAAVGAAYFPDVPRGYTHAVVLPALGVQGRL